MKQFWVDVVKTVAYLINHRLIVLLEHRIPREIWSGKEVRLSYLKVFCCVSYIHISDQSRNTL